MRALIIAAGALALAACGGTTATENTEANVLATDNLAVDTNMTMDANMTGGMDANMATNSMTEANMMATDMNTNAPDTNIANGM